MGKTIEFFFDYLSPYAYLAWKAMPSFTKEFPDIEIKYTPILFAGLLNHWGQKGPAEIPPKKDYVFTQCLRIATRQGISFTLPKFHPFNPVTCLRLSLVELSGDQQHKIMTALWQAGWEQGRDLGDTAELAKILSEHNISTDFIEKTNAPEIKDVLKRNTTRAIEQGVFGVPTFITQEGSLFWGLDSLVDLKACLKDENNIDEKKLHEILTRESAVQRVQNKERMKASL